MVKTIGGMRLWYRDRKIRKAWTQLYACLPTVRLLSSLIMVGNPVCHLNILQRGHRLQTLDRATWGSC